MCLECEPENDHGCCRLQMTLARRHAQATVPKIYARRVAIHPMIGIDCLPAVNHQPQFTDHCVSHAADQAIADGALAMALTSLDVAQNSHLRERLMSNKI